MSRFSTVARLTLALSLPLYLAACGLEPGETGEGLNTVPEDFAEASERHGVPSEILMAIARVETRFQMVEGEEEFEGQERRFGHMAIREGLLEQGAELAGATVEQVMTHPQANAIAAAGLLSMRADQLGIDRSDLSAWAPVVADYSGIDDEEAVAEYVHYEVYGALQQGITIEGFEMEPVDVTPDWPLPATWGQRTGDSGSVWTPSPNNSSRSGNGVDFVVIHTCEGSYSGCWGWLTNSSAGVSAHYVVNDSGSQVRQLVDEDRKAWHIAANYDCGNNDGKECWRNGKAMNSISVGIEHAGYASQRSWDPRLIQRSAELSCGITQRHGIPRDSYHIVGHGQLQPWNRTDPGGAWPWSEYLTKIQVECGDIPGSGASPGGGSSGGSGGAGGSGSSSPAPGGSQFVIDSNNGANDTANYLVEVSGNWWASANVRGFYNTGYWVAPTYGISDGAKFKFKETASVCYAVDAWWPAASDRPPAITFIAYDGMGSEVGRKTVNQRISGGRWNRLGTWRFSSGWNQVMLSRWTSSGNYAVADAVRLTPSSSCP